MIQSTPSSPDTFYHPSRFHSKRRLGTGWVQQGAQVTPPPSACPSTFLARQTANWAGPHCRGRTAGGAEASRLQQAPEHKRPLCGELRSGRAGPTGELWTVWPRGPHPLWLPGTPTQTCLPSAGGPGSGGSGAPTPLSRWCACPCVRSCVCAHVSPSQIGYCPRSVRRRATSVILPDLKRCRPGAPCIGSAAPSPSTLRLPPLLSLRWSLAWGSGRAPGLSKWGEGT